MSEFFIGEIANAKVGRNLVEVEILECGEGSFKVKSVSSGREFNTSRLEKINNNQEEAIMPEDNINTIAEAGVNTEAEIETPNPAPECATAKKAKKVSLLDLAAKILADTGEALNCKELVAKAKETGWVSTGKTPEQTLYSGIFREIKEKGEASRFKKSATRKGSFEANA